MTRWRAEPGPARLDGRRTGRTASARRDAARLLRARLAGQRSEVERLALDRHPLDDDTVVQLTEGALPLRDETTPNVCYLGADGDIEYAMDTDEADVAAWLRFLRALDGDRTIGDALNLDGTTHADVDPFLTESLSAGIVEVVAVPAHTGNLRAA